MNITLTCITVYWVRFYMNTVHCGFPPPCHGDLSIGIPPFCHICGPPAVRCMLSSMSFNARALNMHIDSLHYLSDCWCCMWLINCPLRKETALLVRFSPNIDISTWQEGGRCHMVWTLGVACRRRGICAGICTQYRLCRPYLLCGLTDNIPLGWISLASFAGSSLSPEALILCFVPCICPEKAMRWILAGAGTGSADHAYWQTRGWVAFPYPFGSAYHMHASHSSFSWGSWCSSCMSSWTSLETHWPPWSGPGRGTQPRNYQMLPPIAEWVSYVGIVCEQTLLCCHWHWPWTWIPLPSGDWSEAGGRPDQQIDWPWF